MKPETMARRIRDLEARVANLSIWIAEIATTLKKK